MTTCTVGEIVASLNSSVCNFCLCIPSYYERSNFCNVNKNVALRVLFYLVVIFVVCYVVCAQRDRNIWSCNISNARFISLTTYATFTPSCQRLYQSIKDIKVVVWHSRDGQQAPHTKARRTRVNRTKTKIS